MAIPSEGLLLGTVTDIRALVWLQLDELCEATAEEEWSVSGLAAHLAGLLASILYVEQTDRQEADQILVAFVPGARAILGRLRESGMIEKGVRLSDLAARI